MKKLWFITIFYSHIKSYKHLNRNHTKSRNGKLLFRHNFKVPELWCLQFGIVDATIPETGTAMKHRDGAVFLDVSAPCQWQAVHSQEPHWRCDQLLCHSRWEWCHLLFISRGSCGRATPLRFYILETSVPGGGVQQWVLLCSLTLSQKQDLGNVPSGSTLMWND